MKTLKERTKELKQEIIQVLKVQDLVGETLSNLDPIDYPSKVLVIGQDGTLITCEDEIGNEREFDLGEFSIDTLIELVK